MDTTVIETEDDILDKNRIKEEIADRIKALKELKKGASDTMERWARAIHRLRALRDTVFHETGTMEINADAYRKAMHAKLKQREYATYAELEKWERSIMYRLCDCIDDAMEWYRGQAAGERKRWQTPESLLKHMPKTLLRGVGYNKPKKSKPPKNKKPRAMPPEMAAMYGIVVSLADLLKPINEAKAAELQAH
jgi:hypothetical protein